MTEAPWVTVDLVRAYLPSVHLPSKAYNWVPLPFSRRAQANSVGFHDSSAKDKEQAPTHVQTLQIIIMRVSASGESPKTASRPFFFSRSSNSNRPLFPTSIIWLTRAKGQCSSKGFNWGRGVQRHYAGHVTSLTHLSD